MTVCKAVLVPTSVYNSYHKKFWAGGCIVESSNKNISGMTQIMMEPWEEVVNLSHTSQTISALRKGQGILIDDQGLPPSRSSYILSDRHTTKTPGFQRRSRSGEIVSQPMRASKAVGHPKPAIVFEPSGPCNISGGSPVMCEIGDYLPPNNTTCPGLVSYDGKPAWSQVAYKRMHGAYRETAHPWDYVSARDFELAFKTYSPVLEEPGLVQSTLAEANERSVDFLTSLFELPETIISIGQLWTRVKKQILSAFSRRSRMERKHQANLDFLVKNRVALKNKLEKLMWDANIASGKEKGVLAKRIRRTRYQLRLADRNYKNLVIQFANDLSAAWMTWRYEIQTNLYLAQDLLDSATNMSSVYQTTRNRVVVDAWVPQFPGFKSSGSHKTTWRCFVKYGYQPTLHDLEDLRKAFSTNVFLTVWELGTLTFVLDWFFSVGDFLSAYFGKPSLALQQAVALSSKTVFNLQYTHEDTGCSFSVSAEYYNYSPIDPERYLGVFPLINLTWQRLLDSSAIIWGQITRHFKLK